MAFRVILQARALQFIQALSAEEKENLRHSIEILRVDPWVDNVTKFILPAPPVTFLLFQDGPFSIVYRIKQNVVIDILNISRAPYVPPISEWDNWRKN